MRVAALYDLHGNLPAVEAALEAIEASSVDLVVFGGDLCWGPFPAETLRAARALGDRAVFVRGNADRELADRLDEEDGLEAWIADVNRWCWEHLDDEAMGFLSGLPTDVPLEVEGLGPVLFCHGSPRDDEEVMSPYVSEERLHAILEGVDEGIVVCGHTHVAFDLRAAGKRIVNPGSVGLPFGSRGAHWALLGPDVSFETTTYDVTAAASAFRSSGCPDAAGFAEHVLSPPDGEAHLKRLAGS